jgi:hypothetical protein
MPIADRMKMSANWDADAFRRRMTIAADWHESYRREHRDRLRRGQSHGSESMHDHVLGEWWVCHRLGTSAATDRPEDLRRELAEMREAKPRFAGAFDQGDARMGYEHQIDSLLAELEKGGF